MNTIFDIEQKQNSQEMLDYVAGKPTKFFLFSDELNDVARKALESTVHDIKLDFSWSNKPEHRVQTLDGVNFMQLLIMDFRAEWVLNNVDEVYLIINRYKPKKQVRIGEDIQYKESGFKHEIYNNSNNVLRPSEILITKKITALNFGQQYYFSPFNKALFRGSFEDEIEKQQIRASGFGSKNHNSNSSKAWVYLQFSIKVVKNGNVFYSNPKAVIEMICHIEKDGIHISYKLK